MICTKKTGHILLNRVEYMDAIRHCTGGIRFFARIPVLVNPHILLRSQVYFLNILFIMGRAELFLLLNKKSENENGDGIPVDGNLVG